MTNAELVERLIESADRLSAETGGSSDYAAEVAMLREAAARLAPLGEPEQVAREIATSVYGGVIEPRGPDRDKLHAALAERITAALTRAVAAATEKERERCARWHDERRYNTPDAFEMEFHEVSAAALRNPGAGETNADQSCEMQTELKLLRATLEQTRRDYDACDDEVQILKEQIRDMRVLGTKAERKAMLYWVERCERAEAKLEGRKPRASGIVITTDQNSFGPGAGETT